jgi:hypothetical protein
VLHLSVSQVIILLALSFVWAALGYRLSENDRRTLGRTPWGLSSYWWAFFWFLSLLLGLILYLFAHAAGVRRAHENPTTVGMPGQGAPSSMGLRPGSSSAPTAAEQFPAYPQPANSQPPPPTPGPPEPAIPPAHAPFDQDPHEPTDRPGGEQQWPHSPPAWHPDPSGRFHFRWWDGYQWTSQVSTDGQHLIDTNPDQRIGPY